MSGFRHVVLFRFREDATAEQTRTLEERLRALPGAIPEVTGYAVGGDAGINPGNPGNPGNADFAVVADFADREGYLAYRDHPEHRKVVDEYVNPIVAERLAVQYSL